MEEINGATAEGSWVALNAINRAAFENCWCAFVALAIKGDVAAANTTRRCLWRTEDGIVHNSCPLETALGTTLINWRSPKTAYPK